MLNHPYLSFSKIRYSSTCKLLKTCTRKVYEIPEVFNMCRQVGNFMAQLSYFFGPKCKDIEGKKRRTN